MNENQFGATRAVRVSLPEAAGIHSIPTGRAHAVLLVHTSIWWLRELRTDHPRGEGRGHAFLPAVQLLLHW